jgi:tuftelin-interacting protein 11
MPPPPQSSITYATPASELTLRDLVQQFAEEHGVPFVPKFGRFHDGLQVGFDNLSRQALQRVI